MMSIYIYFYHKNYFTKVFEVNNIRYINIIKQNNNEHQKSTGQIFKLNNTPSVIKINKVIKVLLFIKITVNFLQTTKKLNKQVNKH